MSAEHSAENELRLRSPEKCPTWCACGCGVRVPDDIPGAEVYTSPRCFGRSMRRVIPPTVTERGDN